MGALAVALARECFFGKSVMKKSSVFGRGPGTIALNSTALVELKKCIFSLCPAYHGDMPTFEKMVWRKCVAAINHACNKYR